jgi:hypothetical protein
MRTGIGLCTRTQWPLRAWRAAAPSARAGADAGALAFHEHRPLGRSRASACQTRVSKCFCDGCGSPGIAAQDGAAVVRQAFQVEHLRAGCAQRLQQPRLAAAGAAAQHAVVQQRRQREPGRRARGREGLVAALQLRGAKADLRQHQRQAARALAAAPAVHQRAPFAGLSRTCVSRMSAMRRDTSAAPSLRAASGEVCTYSVPTMRARRRPAPAS